MSTNELIEFYLINNIGKIRKRLLRKEAIKFVETAAKRWREKKKQFKTTKKQTNRCMVGSAA